jgi:hypothetical protein
MTWTLCMHRELVYRPLVGHPYIGIGDKLKD